MVYKPVVGSRGPRNMVRPLLMLSMLTWCWVNLASHPLSQNWPMEMRVVLLRSGKMCAVRAFGGRFGKSSKAVWDAWMLVP